MDKVRFGGRSFKKSVKADGGVVSDFSLHIVGFVLKSIS